MLRLKHGELLLLIQGDLIFVVPSDPGVLQGSDRIVSLRGRIAAQIEEKVLRQRSEALREIEF